MEKKKITEEMGLHDEWYKRAKSMNPDGFPEFFREMTEDYVHDYGTVCHAMAAIGLAAMFAFNNSDRARGGITGFQAGFVMWQIIRHMNYENNKCGLRLLDMDNLLYPQYEYKFHSIDSDIWKAVQKEAENKIYESKAAHEKYLKDMEQYRLDLDKFKEDVKKFELKHPEYPKYEDNPKFYEHLGSGTVEEWDKEKQKEESGFLFSPREPYDGAAHPNVVAHWESIANGNIPFGLRIED